MKYLFGPVPSRRLGLSLGVDLVPFKFCTQDCIYCQLGQTQDATTVQRKSFVPIDDVVAELKQQIDEGLKADYVTLSGSGEPTLNTDFGDLIDKIHAITDIPVALITNGTLLHLPQVRADAAKADLIVPSLDCFDQTSFEKINRPSKDVNFDSLLAGLIELRKEYTGKFWLEVFFIDGINTSDEQVEKLKGLIERIAPDKVQLNTAVRPTAKAGLLPVSPERLKHIADIIGPLAEVIVDYNQLTQRIDDIKKTETDIFVTLKRRPCSIDDLCGSLGIHRNEALKYITHLLEAGKIAAELVGDKTFYKVI